MGRTFHQRGWDDYEVRVRRADLLTRLRENRSKHVADYNEACTGYRAVVLERAEKVFADVREKINRLKKGEVLAIATVNFGLPVPECHDGAYDQIIDMMEMCVNDEVTLTASQFACFVRDDWEWKEAWTTTNAPYFGGVKANWKPNG